METSPEQLRTVAALADKVNGDLQALRAATSDHDRGLALGDATDCTAILRDMLPFRIVTPMDPSTGLAPEMFAIPHAGMDVYALHETLVRMGEVAADPDALIAATREVDAWTLEAAQRLAVNPEIGDHQPWFADVAERYRRRQLAHQLRDLERANQRAREVVKDVEEAASTVSTGNLAEHFVTLEKSERITANVLRLVAVGLLISTTAVGLLLVELPDDPSIADVLQHYAFALPALFIAAYLARESGHHRASARWAAGLAVQLRTFKAFTDAMPEHIRDDIRGVFGRRLFLEANPTGAGGKGSSMSEVDQLLQRLVDLGLGGAKGGPAKQ